MDRATAAFPRPWAIAVAWLLSPLSLIPVVAVLALVGVVSGGGGDLGFFLLVFLVGAAPVVWIATLVFGIPVILIFHRLGWRLSLVRVGLLGLAGGALAWVVSPTATESIFF